MTRKEGNKSVYSLWIFCEGKTERNYFAQLRAVDRIQGLQIRPVIRSLFNFFWFFSNFKRTIEFHPNLLNPLPHFGKVYPLTFKVFI